MAIAECDNCGYEITEYGDWGFNEAECEPTCPNCGAVINLPEGV